MRIPQLRQRPALCAEYQDRKTSVLSSAALAGRCGRSAVPIIDSAAPAYSGVEPLISEELWNRCNKLLANSVNHIARPTRRAVHLFASLAFCGCGEKMYVPRNSRKYMCGKCRTKIPPEGLEGIFVEQLKLLNLQ